MEAVSAPTVIQIEGLGLAFEQEGRRTVVLRGLDLAIRRGEFVALVGPSGVGKSTLLRVLMGLAQPTEGRIRIERGETSHSPLALVFQDARLLPWRRVEANVAFGLEASRLGRAARRQRASSALTLVGLREMARRWPHQLSGGQRQRVALARALAVDPEILLMDEPFSALDIATRETLQEELLRIHAETGTTILFVTHDIDEAVFLADRVVALGGQPGEVKSSRSIDIARPRQRGSAALRGVAEVIKTALSADAALSRDDWVI